MPIKEPAKTQKESRAQALGGLRQKLRWLDPFTYVDDYLLPAIKALPETAQWAIFAFTYIALLFAVFNFFGGTFFVALVLTGIYIYLVAFERNSAVEWSVYAFSAFVFALVLYHVLLVNILGTTFPLMIVYSGSMEPMLYRGDVVILVAPVANGVAETFVDFPVSKKPLHDYADITLAVQNTGIRQSGLVISGRAYAFDKNGPIVVYYSGLQAKEIIHRAVLKIVAPDGNFLVTFGDNNSRIDADCGPEPKPEECINYWPVPSRDLRGKYLFHIPLVGYAKLLIFDDLPKMFSGNSKAA